MRNDNDTRRTRDAAGVGLVEAIIAAGMLVTAMAGVAHLTVVSSTASARAHDDTIALLLAVQKLEELRSLTWTRDAHGAPMTDRSTDLTGPTPGTGGPGLDPSPGDSLERDVEGYVDRIGPTIGASGPIRRRFVRRWSVQRVGAGDDLIRLDVVVIPIAGGIRAVDDQGGPDAVGAVWIRCVRSRHE